MSIIELCYAFDILAIICEIGQRYCNGFDGFIKKIDQFKWYLFPLELQQILPIVITNAQQTVTLKCFGSIACNRENLKKVSSTESHPK